MTNRLIIGAHAGTYVLRASRPGYDVTNDGIDPAGVAFDSRRPNTLKVRLQGYVAWSGSPLQASVSFGMTFAVVPIVFIAARTGSTLTQLEVLFTSTGGFSVSTWGNVTTTGFSFGRFGDIGGGMEYYVCEP